MSTAKPRLYNGKRPVAKPMHPLLGEVAKQAETMTPAEACRLYRKWHRYGNDPLFVSRRSYDDQGDDE